MSFTFKEGCAGILYGVLVNYLSHATGQSGAGDGNVNTPFNIAVGSNGSIVKSTGSDTINYVVKSSGTTQTLNVVRIQATVFQPLIMAAGNSGTVVRSTDQGETWFVTPQATSSNLFAVDVNSGAQFCAGDNGVILMSFNMGTNWMVQSSGTNRNLKGIGMYGGLVVAVGEKGTIVRTTNSGQNWINVSLPDTSINLYCVSQRTRQNFNVSDFYIAGSQGRIYKSTDNGATWSLKNSGTTNTLRSIFFSGNDSGAVSGDNGTLRLTTNAGETWFSDPVFAGLTGTITSIAEMPRTTKTFTALSNGNGPYIISENPPFVGINTISSEVPKGFDLSQNFPNPFNPVTNFRFAIQSSEFVNLTIFDLLGREVETLADQELPAGIYTVQWNAANYPSGIYFYKISAGKFQQTKRMVLVK